MTLSLPPALKRLGQHFLVDQNIARKIVSLAAPRADETVLEIGPGRGILTTLLCETAGQVIAVEIDPKLHAYLKETLREYANLDLRLGDALEFPYESLPLRTVVVANLPYYVSTPLLFRLLDARDRIARMTLMLQAEVAERLVAQPGTKKYGVLSVLARYVADMRPAFVVSPECFRPRPDVASAVVGFVMKPAGPLDQAEEARFTRLVRAAFTHRRKTLLNSLRDEGVPQERIARALERCGIDPSRRAETLSLDEYVALARALDSRELGIRN
ncbi:MAG TPA: 16S rRNA (adenine(1518)-N(6)/adenine(1519)-N(6))-dimethyltransferase RsmA [Nitrospiraceae bacterium]|jgi:16S rRNA (adenine1518-N6/adenine1519-N6)-dimethyltransferase|nr:16S rRNA (adenine(1518)-N(6)/adenine(1519)-N(6))-dimethyltransferase RsmA [Nitrospiraceae bacterium]